jgi:hypothetical protein
VDIYTSDFTSGNEDMAEVNGTGADGQTIGGVSDAYKFTLSGGAVAHYTRTDSSFDRVNSYDVSFDYYIPSGQTINGIRVRTGTTGDGEYDQTTLDAWTSVAIENWTPTSKSTCRFNALVGSSIDPIDADGDVFYLKNIVITQTTADGAVTTFYDQSGNGNDATNSTESEQPLVVSGGTLVEENSKAAVDFDGVDDYFTASNLLTELDNTDFLISAVSADEFSAGSEASVPRLYLRHRAWSYNTLDTMTWSPLTGQSLLSFQVDGATQEVFGNGTSLATASEAQVDFTPTDFQVGRYASTGWMDGKIQELIIYASDQSANRTGIEGNINDHFDIYT